MNQKKPPKKRKEPSLEPEIDLEDESQFDDGYDENLLGDEEDRKRLFSMTEIEREKEITRRYEQRKELQERKRLFFGDESTKTKSKKSCKKK